MHAVGPGTFLGAPNFFRPFLLSRMRRRHLCSLSAARSSLRVPKGRQEPRKLEAGEQGTGRGCALPPARLQVPRVRQGRPGRGPPEPRGAQTAAPGKNRPANFFG